MPQVNRKRVVTERVTTQTNDGEITINLNLKVTIDGDSTIRIEADAAQAPGIPADYARPAIEKRGEESSYKAPEIIPTELFSGEDDLMSGFGQDV